MAIVDTLEVYGMLKREFADAPAKTITEVIEKSLEDYRKSQKDFLATKRDLAETKAELIKWMFIFWAGQVSIMLGMFVAFVKR